MEVESVKIQILGSEYLLRAEGGEESVRRVAEYLNQRLEQVLKEGNPSSTQAALVLAALNITSELIDLKDMQEQLLQEIEANSTRLLDKIVLETG